MRKLAFALVALAVLVVAGSAGARVASEPQVTSPPTIHQDGGKLVLDNGGWQSNSGAIDFYVFRFARCSSLAGDGCSVVKGAQSVPKSQQWGSPTLEGQYPDDPNANVYTLTSTDYGHPFCGDVYAGIHSRYVYSWGEVAYDVIEWGHTYAFDGRQLGWTCVTAQGAAPPPPPPAATPNPAAALAVFTNATLPARRAAKLYATWKASNPREAAALEAYDAAIRNRQKVAVPTVSTPTGKTFVATDEQAAWDAGIHP